MATPTETPRTTQRRRPKMEVWLESWSDMVVSVGGVCIGGRKREMNG